MRDQPEYILPLYGGLVIDAFDGDEGFAERVGGDQVVLELEAQPLAEGDGLGWYGGGRGQTGEEEEEREGIVQISECVDKGRIALLDDVIEGYTGLCGLLQSRRIADLAPSERSGDLLRKGFVVSKFAEDGFMEEILYVFGVVEGGRRGRGLGGFLLVAGLTRVYALVDAEAPKIRKRYLKFANGLGAGDEVLCLARGACCRLSAICLAVASHTIYLSS